jgi:serine phosphatase RsbU (regulator of sigma subunit)
VPVPFGRQLSALLFLVEQQRPHMALLQPLVGGSPGEQIAIPGNRAVLGRHPECDIVLDAAAVSRQHAQILQEGDDFYIEDLHSRNGTFVNGRLVQGKWLLADGDRLKICDLLFTFYRQPPTREMGPAVTMAAAAPGGTLLDVPLEGAGLSGVRADGASTGGFAGGLEIGPRLGDASLVRRTEIVDDVEDTGNSTIMSKVDATPRRSSAQSIVNPEMKLRAMIEIAQNLARAVTLEEVLPKLLDSLFKIFTQADRGFIILRTLPDGPLIPKAIKCRRAELEDRVRISRTIVNQAMESKQALLSADAASDIRFEASQSIADLRIRSLMCAPLINGEGHALGVIQVDTTDQRQRFQKDDLDLLASIASQAAIAVDNAQMHETALKRQSLERDLELAHKVQRGLLPAAPPRMADYHFFDFYESANQVGGDYYDYVDLPDNRLAIVLADVAGKGVSAALLMAKLSGEVRYCLASERTPAAALNRINAAFSRAGWDDRFVTFILAVLDRSHHQVTIVNAGHMPPLLRRGGGQVESVGEGETGYPLGIDADFAYQQCVRPLSVGDSLTMFTDGISEAMNASGELYGLERLRTQMATHSAGPSGVGRQILDDVRRFVGGQPQSDDMCLVSFGRL